MEITDYPLDTDTDDVLVEVERDADEAFSLEAEGVFFYGQLNPDTAPFADKYENAVDPEKYYALCPACGELFEYDPKNAPYIECPRCHQDGTAYDFRDKDDVVDLGVTRYAYLDSYDEGYVLRMFECELDYSDRDVNDYDTLSCIPTLYTYEVARQYWHRGEIHLFENTEREPFVNNKTLYDFKEVAELDEERFYLLNGDNPFDPMSECGFIDEIFLYKGIEHGPYIRNATRSLDYKIFRTLRRHGFDSLSAEYILAPSAFFAGDKISDILGTNYDRLKALPRVDVDVLLMTRELDGLGIQVNYLNVDIMGTLKSRNFNYPQDQARRLFKYLRNQAHKRKIGGNITRDYIDYIGECKKLNYDIRQPEICYPTDLTVAHARTSAIIEYENRKPVEEAVFAAYRKLHHLCEWSDGEFRVIMPKHCGDIILEGKEQSNCVGGYCERVAKGEDVILFIRRVDEPRKAFYTMEIRPDMKKLSVVQCRGFKNDDPSKEDKAAVEAFVEKYRQWFDTRRATAATKLIRTYYKAVEKRADGRYISLWDKTTEYVVGQTVTAPLNEDPDRVAVSGIHMASLEFAQKYGDTHRNGKNEIAILELEVNIHDVVVPDAKDQIRASQALVVREVPMSEMGDWGARHRTAA